MSSLHFYLANLLSTCLPPPASAAERITQGATGASYLTLHGEIRPGQRGAHKTEAFDQKATHTFPHKAVCLKPAQRVYAVYRLPSGENSRWLGAARLVWNDRIDGLISSLVMVSRHETEKKKKSCLTRTETTFLWVSDKAQNSLSSHEDVPSLLCGKHKSSRLLENNNLVSEKLLNLKETTVFTDAAMQWHKLSFGQPQKSSAEIFLCPWAHAKVNVVGVLRTLRPEWITVDAPKEYIYSHMRTAIITDVVLEDKAGPYVVSPQEEY